VRDAADRAFHLTIAEATGNGALVLSVATLWDMRHGDLWAATEEHFHTPALRAKTLADHQAIADALAAHDPQAARAAMRKHLGRVAREFQRRIDAKPVTAQRPAASRPPAPGARSAISELK
jgi:DNA-binding FadR family transcriptional regulator